LEDWHRYFDSFVPSEQLRHEWAAVRACRLAAMAVERGTYGVGAVLLDERGEILLEGHNEVHVGAFRSDLHAEMVVLNRFESGVWSREIAKRCTLVTSLEPCPMCTTRLIVAGIGTVLYVSSDAVGGMVERMDVLPPAFRKITREQSQVWGLAECSEELRSVAHRIWDESREMLAMGLPVPRNRVRESAELSSDGH
jgi:tRNA(adenine34) deaminase